VNVPEPRLLTVKPWDKGQVKAIDKAIREGDLGLNPQVDGDLIRIPIPALTEDRRRDLVKVIKKNGEECKVAIRKHRRDAMELVDQLQKDGEVSEDDAERGRKKVEDLTAELVKGVDTVIAGKEKDVMEV
jgi:ribosome recycling factor